MNQKISIVMYHYVRELKNSRYSKIKGLDINLFKKQIEFLKHNYNIVKMEDVLLAYKEKINLPEKAMLLTFDDGYIDHFMNVFPILKNNDIQGSFFISGKTFVENKVLDVNKIHFILASTKVGLVIKTLFEKLDYFRGIEHDIPSNKELLDKYTESWRYDSEEVIFVKNILQRGLTKELRTIIINELFNEFVNVSESTFSRELYINYDQIKCMKRYGMFFGSHGYDHYWMNTLSENELVTDIEKSLECMSEIIDINKWVINYPYGSYSEKVIDIVQKKGSILGLSTDIGLANILEDDIFKLPRFDTNDFPPKSETYKIWDKL